MTEVTKTCPHHGELSADNIYTGKTRHGKPRYSCKLCTKDRSARRYAANREKLLKQNLEWTRRNKDKLKAIRIKTRAKNRDAQNERAKEKYKKHIENLDDCYIKMILARFGGMKFKDVPQQMIDIKRCCLKIKRIVWKNNDAEG